MLRTVMLHVIVRCQIRRFLLSSKEKQVPRFSKTYRIPVPNKIISSIFLFFDTFNLMSCGIGNDNTHMSVLMLIAECAHQKMLALMHLP